MFDLQGTVPWTLPYALFKIIFWYILDSTKTHYDQTDGSTRRNIAPWTLCSPQLLMDVAKVPSEVAMK